MKDIRHGTVLVFKEGVTKEQAEKALETIKDVIDLDNYVAKKPTVHEFDPKLGGPVWYLP